MIYKCTITTGGGTEQDGGDFIVKETPKTLTFECVRKPFLSSYNQMIYKPVRIQKYYPKKYLRVDGKYEAFRKIKEPLEYIGYFNNGHVARLWEDGTWTVYPNQCGIPHYLEKV